MPSFNAEGVEFPRRVLRLIEEHHANAVTEEDCLACASSCCSHPGFAILENVERIYDLYAQGQLKREDYEFSTDLSFDDFVQEYFNITCSMTGRLFWRKRCVMFHMKSLSADGQLISIPRYGDFYAVRHALFSQNRWLNKGCIFLSKKVPEWPENDKEASRKCLLHTNRSATHLTAKPIDCIYHTCIKPYESKTPTLKKSEKWSRALAVCYPGSFERFNKLIGDPEGKRWG